MNRAQQIADALTDAGDDFDPREYFLSRPVDFSHFGFKKLGDTPEQWSYRIPSEEVQEDVTFGVRAMENHGQPGYLLSFWLPTRALRMWHSWVDRDFMAAHAANLIKEFETSVSLGNSAHAMAKLFGDSVRGWLTRWHQAGTQQESAEDFDVRGYFLSTTSFRDWLKDQGFSQQWTGTIPHGQHDVPVYKKGALSVREPWPYVTNPIWEPDKWVASAERETGNGRRWRAHASGTEQEVWDWVRKQPEVTNVWESEDFDARDYMLSGETLPEALVAAGFWPKPSSNADGSNEHPMYERIDSDGGEEGPRVEGDKMWQVTIWDKDMAILYLLVFTPQPAGQAIAWGWHFHETLGERRMSHAQLIDLLPRLSREVVESEEAFDAREYLTHGSEASKVIDELYKDGWLQVHNSKHKAAYNILGPRNSINVYVYAWDEENKVQLHISERTAGARVAYGWMRPEQALPVVAELQKVISMGGPHDQMAAGIGEVLRTMGVKTEGYQYESFDAREYFTRRVSDEEELRIAGAVEKEGHWELQAANGCTFYLYDVDPMWNMVLRGPEGKQIHRWSGYLSDMLELASHWGAPRRTQENVDDFDPREYLLADAGLTDLRQWLESNGFKQSKTASNESWKRSFWYYNSQARRGRNDRSDYNIWEAPDKPGVWYFQRKDTTQTRRSGVREDIIQQFHGTPAEILVIAKKWVPSVPTQEAVQEAVSTMPLADILASTEPMDYPGYTWEQAFQSIENNHVTADPAHWNKFLESVRQHGIRKPVEIERWGSRMRLWKGHHRVWAAHKLGIKDVPVKMSVREAFNARDYFLSKPRQAGPWPPKGFTPHGPRGKYGYESESFKSADGRDFKLNIHVYPKEQRFILSLFGFYFGHWLDSGMQTVGYEDDLPGYIEAVKAAIGRTHGTRSTMPRMPDLTPFKPEVEAELDEAELPVPTDDFDPRDYMLDADVQALEEWLIEHHFKQTEPDYWMRTQGLRTPSGDYRRYDQIVHRADEGEWVYRCFLMAYRQGPGGRMDHGKQGTANEVIAALERWEKQKDLRRWIYGESEDFDARAYLGSMKAYEGPPPGKEYWVLFKEGEYQRAVKLYKFAAVQRFVHDKNLERDPSLILRVRQMDDTAKDYQREVDGTYTEINPLLGHVNPRYREAFVDPEAPVEESEEENILQYALNTPVKPFGWIGVSPATKGKRASYLNPRRFFMADVIGDAHVFKRRSTLNQWPHLEATPVYSDPRKTGMGALDPYYKPRVYDFSRKARIPESMQPPDDFDPKEYLLNAPRGRFNYKVERDTSGYGPWTTHVYFGDEEIDWHTCCKNRNEAEELGVYWVTWLEKLDALMPYDPIEYPKWLDWYEKAYRLGQQRGVGESQIPQEDDFDARAYLLDYREHFDQKQTVHVPDEQTARQRAAADLERVRGMTFTTGVVSGYLGPDSVDTDDYYAPEGQPFHVRITGGDPKHWNDNYLDPYWDVELVEPHPMIPEGSRLWIFGISYTTEPVAESLADDIAKEAEKAEQPKSEEQAEAGNQKKGHIHLHGWEIAIENAKGSVRQSKDPENPWKVTMPAHYGYIKGTVGKDKDHLDVYIGEHPSALLAFVVNQKKKEGGFDEHKIMLGFQSKDEAIETYDKAFTGDLGPKLRDEVFSVTVDNLKAWIEKGDTKKPFKPVEESRAAFIARALLETDDFDPREYLLAPSGPDDVLRRQLPSFGFKLVKQRTEQDPEEVWQAVISGITHTVAQRDTGYGWTYEMDTVPNYSVSSGPENILNSLERSMPKAKGLRLLPGRGRRLRQGAYGPYYAVEAEEPFDARQYFMDIDKLPLGRAVDISDDIWKDDNKLRKAFSWMTRIGAAPKFGTTSIHNYQSEQVEKLDAIKVYARQKGVTDVKWVRYRNGRIYAYDVNKWVPVASLIFGNLVPNVR